MKMKFVHFLWRLCEGLWMAPFPLYSFSKRPWCRTSFRQPHSCVQYLQRGLSLDSAFFIVLGSICSLPGFPGKPFRYCEVSDNSAVQHYRRWGGYSAGSNFNGLRAHLQLHCNRSGIQADLENSVNVITYALKLTSQQKE